MARVEPQGPQAFRFSPKQPPPPEMHSFSQQHPLTFGGSPVLAWRRQHRRNTRSVGAQLAPLDRTGWEVKDLTFDGAEVSPPSACVRKHASLPPGDRLGKPSGDVKVLWGRVQEGPPLRPSLTPSSLAKVQPQAEREGMSAMALDLLSVMDKPTELEDKRTELEAKPELKGQEQEVMMEQLWFSIGELEAQVRQWRKQVPAPKAGSGLDFCEQQHEDQELLSDSGDDEDLESVCSAPMRVRPGEFLVWPEPPMQQVNREVEVIVTEEDVAMFTAENAVDAGMRQFFPEVLLDDDEFEQVDVEWDCEEEV